ncbi:MAG: dihydropteroate synthase [Gemmatimonadales bacterium]
MTKRVLLGLGSNVPDRISHLRRAVRALGQAQTDRFRLLSISPIYESDALLPDDAPPEWNIPYLNLAVLGTTSTDPLDLLDWLKQLEQRLGRGSGPRWSPRQIDLDLLAIDGVRLAVPRLTLPHREAAHRPFVLLPVADLAPDWTFAHESGGDPLTAAQLARPWRTDPGAVPFRTRRVAHSLTELVGILNLTDDSFSDGGLWTEPSHAIAHAEQLATDGASVIDLGAESTRPGASSVAPDNEWQRLEPVLGALRRRWVRGTGPRLSVDTRHAATAARAILAGVDWINDVTGFEDAAMLDAVRGFDGDIVVMHSLSVPPRADLVLPVDRDPIESIYRWASSRVDHLTGAGIPLERIIIDPGIGFGKTAQQTVQVLARLGELRPLGLRLLVGHSRKSFLKTLFAEREGDPCWDPADRETETMALGQSVAEWGVDYLRVHGVRETARTLAAGALVGRPTSWHPISS